MRKTLTLLLLILLIAAGARPQAPESGFLPKYSLGGLLFAGNFPINNPAPNGDLGYAILYRMDGIFKTPLDTLLFDSLGYYYFTDVEEGAYLIKAGLMENSAHFSGWLPAYYGDASVWHGADTLYLTRDEFNADIRMEPLPGLSPGEGEISGYVNGENPVDAYGREGWCEVILSDTQFHAIACTYTNPEGTFAFPAVANGGYYLFAESAGLFSSKEMVQVDPQHLVTENVEIHLFTAAQGVDPGTPESPALTLCPNPASGRVTVQFSPSFTSGTLSLSTLLGETVRREQVTLTGGTKSCTLNLAGLTPGVYLLTATGPAGTQTVEKLIIY